MRTLALLSLLLVAVVTASDDKRSYSGYRVLRVRVENAEQADELSALEAKGLVDLWNDLGVDGSMDVMVSPAVDAARLLKGMRHSVYVEDVQALIDAESKTIAALAESKSRSRKALRYNLDWESYHPLEDFDEYLDFLAETYPDLASTETIGQSYEGRDLRLLKICRGGCGNKPAMYIEGGIHAREWVSPTVVLFMARELTERMTPNKEDLLDGLDWYILPSVNPDGYQYTRDSDRLWRKTRSETGSALGCKGADPNRNWDFHWGEAGNSTEPCADTFHGLGPFSEVEVLAASRFIDAHKDRIRYFVDVHSYSQYVLLPWGFESPTPPPDQVERRALADRANAALLAVNGSVYDVGSITELLYPAAGGSLDWTLGVAGIKYSFGMELRDTGEHGFLLPPEQIVPTGEEVWAFHVSAARDVIAEEEAGGRK